MRMASVTLWIGTRKGAFALRTDARRRRWTLSGPQFLGHIDPPRRAGSARPQHAADGGQDRAPGTDGVSLRAIAAAAGRKRPRRRRSARRRTGEQARAVERVFWLTPGSRAAARRVVRGHGAGGSVSLRGWRRALGAGRGLQRSPDVPASGPPGPRTPDGELLHSILRRSARCAHLYLAISIGGVFESTDGGATGRRSTRASRRDFLPDPERRLRPRSALRDAASAAARPPLPAEPLRHLPARSPGAALAADRRARCPRSIGDIGFPIVAASARSRTPRGCCRWTAPGLAAHLGRRASPRCTRRATAAGRWQRRDRGLPRAQAWFTVLRQAMCSDDRGAARAVLRHHRRRGLGAAPRAATTGAALRRHLPEIYSVSAALP